MLCKFAVRSVGKLDEKRAIFWTAWGEQHMEEARVSALSAKKQMPGITRVLFTRVKEKRRVKSVDPFNIVIAPNFGKLPSHRPEGLESLFYRVNAIDQLTDYYRLLFLDSDTYVCAPVYELFEALDRFDIMGVIAAGRVTRRTSVYIPEAYPELNGGVMAFKNTEKVRAFWRACKDLYVANVHLYRRGNQGAIREAIWRDKSGLQVGVAPNEYCCRFPFGFWALGQVKILHGRANRLPFSRIEEVINQVYPRMRAWGPGCFSEPHPGFRAVKLPYSGRGRLK